MRTVEVKAVYVDTESKDGKRKFKSPMFTLVTDDNERYSTFDGTIGKILEESKGKLIDIELVQSGKFTNIEAVSPHASSPNGGQAAPPLRQRDPSDSRMIVRQVALKCATDLVVGKVVAADLLLATADKLVRWVYEQSEVKRMTSEGEEV